MREVNETRKNANEPDMVTNPFGKPRLRGKCYTGGRTGAAWPRLNGKQDLQPVLPPQR